MRATVLFFLALGCTGDPCETEAATQCAESNVQTCVDGNWETTIDCVGAGQVCMQDASMMEGEAHCMGETMEM